MEAYLHRYMNRQKILDAKLIIYSCTLCGWSEEEKDTLTELVRALDYLDAKTEIIATPGPAEG